MTETVGKSYVAYRLERMQDGWEESTKIFHSVRHAIDWVNQYPIAPNETVRLFELGQEIPLEITEIREPQPDRVTKGCKIKE